MCEAPGRAQKRGLCLTCLAGSTGAAPQLSSAACRGHVPAEFSLSSALTDDVVCIDIIMFALCYFLNLSKVSGKFCWGADRLLGQAIKRASELFHSVSAKLSENKGLVLSWPKNILFYSNTR